MTQTLDASATTGPQLRRERCLLLKLGEVVLKGRNRDTFEKRLRDNIRSAASDVPGELTMWKREGVIAVATTGDVDALADRLRDVIGLVWIHRAWRVAKDPEAITRAAVEMVAPRAADGVAFAVRARRRDKRFPLSSTQLASHVGSAVQQAYGLPVRLKNPDLAVFIEIDRDEAFVFTDGEHGQGGLPVGVSGRALVLMSGGIDSPVSAYRMMRRGLRCDFLHFSGMPFTGPESIYKAYGLVRELDRFQGRSRLFVVPFGKAQQRIKTSGEDRLQIIAQRRLMLKTAQVLAARLHAAALVTGDSLGQVSSQTLANLTVLDDAVELPILRPLIGWDKSEIMNEARRLGTLGVSELPDEDCCTVLAPRRAETRAKVEDLWRVERRIGVGDLAEELAASASPYRLDRQVTPA